MTPAITSPLGYKDLALFALIAAAVISYVWLASAAMHLNHDIGFFLHTAKRVLAGDVLYVDIVLSNTPWIVYLMIIPVRLGQLLSIPVDRALYAFVLMVGFTSLVLCWILIRTRLFDAAAAWTLLMFLAIIMFMMPDFTNVGEREHLFVLLILPYVFACLCRVQHLPIERWLSICVGLLAAAGIIIKPHFTFTLMVSELCMVAFTRQWLSWWRADSLIIIAACVLYYLCVALYFPAIVDTMPLLLAMYPGYELSYKHLLLRALPDLLSFLILVGLLYAFSKQPNASSVLRPLGYMVALMVAAYVQFLSHRAGFHYQRLPYDLFVYLCVAIGLLSVEQIRKLPFVILAACLLPLYYVTFMTPIDRTLDEHAKAEFEVLAHKYHGRSVTVLSTSMFPAFPFINYIDGRMDSALAILFYLPAMYMDQRNTHTEAQYHTPETMPPVERQFFNATVEDVVFNRPDLLLVAKREDNQGLNGMYFDMIAYFSQDPRFTEAIEAYAPTGDALHKATIWKRKPGH